MGRLRGRSSGLGTFLSAARSASTEGDLGILLPRSPQLQGHLHLKWEPGPLAACLRLIARPGGAAGTKPANAISEGGGLCTSKVLGSLIAASRPQTSPRPPFISAQVEVASRGWQLLGVPPSPSITCVLGILGTRGPRPIGAHSLWGCCGDGAAVINVRG